MMAESAGPRALRRCPQCGKREAIGPDERLWPSGWRCPSCGATLPSVDGISMLAPQSDAAQIRMSPDAFDGLSLAEDSHFWFRTRNRLLTGLVNKYCHYAKSFLEVGCGNGTVLRAMAGARKWERIAGMEFHVNALLNARARLGDRVELIQADARKIMIEGAFDMVGAFDVIEHIVEDEAVIRQMRSALAPGGHLILAVPQHPFLWSASDVAAQHVRRYRRGELESKLSAAGMQPIFSTSFVSLLLPGMLASRLARRGAAMDAKVEANAEFSIPPWLNRAFGIVTDLEVNLSLSGVRWPMGGSRMVLARRAE